MMMQEFSACQAVTSELFSGPASTTSAAVPPFIKPVQVGDALCQVCHSSEHNSTDSWGGSG